MFRQPRALVVVVDQCDTGDPTSSLYITLSMKQPIQAKYLYESLPDSHNQVIDICYKPTYVTIQPNATIMKSVKPHTILPIILYFPTNEVWYQYFALIIKSTKWSFRKHKEYES